MRKLIDLNVFGEERSDKTGKSSKTGRSETRKTSHESSIRFRAGRASATNLQPAKLDKSAKKRNVYLENRNIYAENLNSETG
ncbi:MAG: hypothetical protein ACOYN4_19820 [Bacteroidales bacterium]